MPKAPMNSMIGRSWALFLTPLITARNVRSFSSLNRLISCPSAAKDLMIRTPATVSSVIVVMSAIFPCTTSEMRRIRLPILLITSPIIGMKRNAARVSLQLV